MDEQPLAFIDAGDSRRGRYARFAIVPVLCAVTVAIYWRAGGFPFALINDDQMYVTKNPWVGAGITREGISWALTALHASNWHPLTWLSHMLDVELFGMDPGRHHQVNLLFHVANTVLLYLVLSRMTGLHWQSGFVAALFAVHPLHVESVVWIAERKDVLSMFFFLLALWTYAGYAARGGKGRYLLLMLFFALGLMAKPMLVTLPFVLLLLDDWPLCRFRTADPEGGLSIRRNAQLSAGRLLLEKAPLFLLTAASCVITYVAQERTGAVIVAENLSFPDRMSNALVSYVRYIGKTVWPSSLAVYYPHPGSALPFWQVAGAGLLLLLLTSIALVRWRRRPWFAVGWFWYLGTLVPVIGFVQVGGQAMADRYTYIPLTGLFVIVAFGIPGLVPAWNRRKAMIAASAGAVLAALCVATWLQVGYWRNDIALFGHAVEVTSNNWFAENNLGTALSRQGRYEEAISHYNEAVRLNPAEPNPRANLGEILVRQGRLEEAVGTFRGVLHRWPENVEALNNLGVVLGHQGKIEEAEGCFKKAVMLKPDDGELHYNLGSALMTQGKVDEAISHYREAVRLLPGNQAAMDRLKGALTRR